MSKNIFFYCALIVLPVFFGCRPEPLPEVTPLPEDHGKVKISLDVNISDNSEKTAKAAKKTVSAPSDSRKSVPAARKKTVQKTPAPAKAESTVSAGVIDSDLNSVEQQYVQQVRQRNRQMRRKSQKDVFGSWMP